MDPVTERFAVDPSNAEQAKAWDGDEGRYWAAHAQRFDDSLTFHHGPFMAAAGIGPDHRVLDLGCGAGHTTLEAARAAADGFALGVDLSAEMLAVARKRAADAGVSNVEFVHADAQVHGFDPAAFDRAISRTGAMFFGDPVAAFTNVARALRPGATLTLLTWQPLAGNEWIRSFLGALAAGRDLPGPPPGAPGPFALSEPDRVRQVLTASGFDSIELASSVGPMWFGPDADDAAGFIGGLMSWLLEGLDEAGRRAALDALRATMAEHHTADGVAFQSSAWIITAVRR